MIRDRQKLALRVAAGAGCFIVLVLLGLVLYLQTQNLAPFARPLEVALGQALGREVIISGAVRAPLFPRPRLIVEGLFIANGEGGSKPHLMLADKVTADLAPVSLVPLRWRTVHVRVEGANFHLERLPDGSANFALSALTARGGAPEILGELPASFVLLPDSIFALDTRITAGPGGGEGATIERLALQLSGGRADRLSVFGQSRGNPVSFEGKLRPLAGQQGQAGFEVQGAVKALGAALTLEGHIKGTTNPEIDLTLAGGMADLAPLSEGLTGWRIGEGMPAEVKARIIGTLSDGRVLAAFPKLGEGDLALELRYIAGPEFTLVGAAEATRLDAELFFVRKPRSDGRLFGAEPFPVASLRTAQIDFGLVARELVLGGKGYGEFQASLWADQGILAVNPLRLRGDRGEVIGDLTFDVRSAPRLTVQLKGHDVAIGEVGGEEGDATGTGGGRLDFAFELSGSGANLQALLANAYGQANLVGAGLGLPQGVVGALPMDIWQGAARPPEPPAPSEAEAASEKKDAAKDGLAVTAAAPPEAARAIVLRCLVSRFDIERGIAKSGALLVDTGDAVITGHGEIDLGNEALALRLAPRPKDPRKIAFARDYAVSGALTAPQATPVDSATKGLARMTGQAILGVEGFASLMPLLTLDAAGANPCLAPLLSAEEAREAKALLLTDGEGSGEE